MDKTLRSGTLQFYPRKRAARMLPSVNWKTIENAKGFLGLIGYKVGMISVYAKDMTEDSMSKNKKVVVPATVMECPGMKIFSVRFYKDNKVIKDVIVSNEKNLKKKVRVPKMPKEIDKEVPEDYDDVRVIVYSFGANKKTPNMIEIGIGGSKEEKLKLIKEKIGKVISVEEIFSNEIVDVRGLTKGKGLQGPVKRFGITLKSHKSEKGQRRPGSLAPWHPARVTFRAPQAGQLGMFTRISYNSFIMQVGKISESDINKKQGFHKYGNIKTNYIILRGSIPGARKRALLVTKPLRPTRLKAKQKFEVLELR